MRSLDHLDLFQMMLKGLLACMLVSFLGWEEVR